MTPAITIEELLAWSQEASSFWKAYLDANPAVLPLPCDIGRTKNVQEFVRHIWAVDLFWARCIAGLPELDREKVPAGPLDALFDLHLEGVKLIRSILDDPAFAWDEKLNMDFPWMPPEGRTPTRRKALTHVLLHSQRHWAQMATLVRTAGFPSGFKGDMLFSSALA
ncbi:MAG TPA: DinB family protein [Terracidiphilus sp.]|nr:DinB family protein [Terracidiphilus sp.]